MKTKLTLALVALLLVSVWQTPVSVISQTQPPWPKAKVKIDPKLFDAYVGQYQTGYSFFREGDKFA